MKIFTRIVLDVATNRVLESSSFEYDGPVANLKGGGKSKSTSSQSYLIPSLLPDIEAGARSAITGPAQGQFVTVPGMDGMGETLADLTTRRAVNQIRGGYGARGMAGSGIAQQGETDAIKQIYLDEMQRTQTALTNLLAAGSGQQTTQKQGSTGLTVICTELHRQGLMSDEMYLADHEFGLSMPRHVIAGYQMWAIPVVRQMRKSPLFTRFVAILVLNWAQEMYHKVTGKGKGSLVGKGMLLIGVPVCGLIGSLMAHPQEAVV